MIIVMIPSNIKPYLCRNPKLHRKKEKNINIKIISILLLLLASEEFIFIFEDIIPCYILIFLIK